MARGLLFRPKRLVGRGHGANRAQRLGIDFPLGPADADGNTAVGVAGDQRLPLLDGLSRLTQGGTLQGRHRLHDPIPGRYDAAYGIIRLRRRVLAGPLSDGNHSAASKRIDPRPLQLWNCGKEGVFHALTPHLGAGSKQPYARFLGGLQNFPGGNCVIALYLDAQNARGQQEAEQHQQA